MLNSVCLAISQVVRMPASYVTVWFVKSQRVRTVRRQFTGDTLEVEYSIDVPLERVADFTGTVAAEASLNIANVSLFTSLLQDNIDSSFGEGGHLVSVLAIEVVVVDETNDTPAGLGDSLSSILVIVACGALCCLGCPCATLALIPRRRRFQALRLERDKAQKHGGNTECTPPGDRDALWSVQSHELPDFSPEVEAPSCRPSSTVQLMVADEGEYTPICNMF